MVNIKISPLVAWLAILVAVAIFAKVFWLVSTVQPILKQPSSERMMQTQEIESPAVSELEVPSAQESADWKVYHDDDFFFEVRYPQTWFLDERRLSGKKIVDFEIGSDNAPVSFGAYSRDKDVFLKPGSKILPFDYAKKFEAAKLLGQYSSGFLPSEEYLPYYRYEWIDAGTYEGTSFGKHVVYEVVGRGKEEYTILFEWSEMVPDAEGLVQSSVSLESFEKVFSTFKFIYKSEKQETTLYKGNGIQVSFEDGYEEKQPSSEWMVSRLEFGPVKYVSHKQSYAHIHALIFKEKKSGEEVIADIEASADYVTMPKQEIINGMTVVKWTAGGSECASVSMEIVGKMMNYELQNNSCLDEKEIFDSFETILSQMKFLE